MSRKFVNFVKEGLLGVNEVAGGFWGVCGGRDEGRCFFCFWYLTFVSVLFFLVFRRWRTKKAQRQKKHLALTVSLVGEMIEINRKGLLLLVFTVIATLEKALAVTQITDSNFHSAIETCLGTNPVDGLCSSSEYGSMPDWDVSLVTDMSGWTGSAFKAFAVKVLSTATLGVGTQRK